MADECRERIGLHQRQHRRRIGDLELLGNEHGSPSACMTRARAHAACAVLLPDAPQYHYRASRDYCSRTAARFRARPRRG
jgi:hypothetical protein